MHLDYPQWRELPEGLDLPCYGRKFARGHLFVRSSSETNEKHEPRG